MIDLINTKTKETVRISREVREISNTDMSCPSQTMMCVTARQELTRHTWRMFVSWRKVSAHRVTKL